MPQLTLHLFGSPRVEVDGRLIKISRRKSVALLAYLALEPRPHSRDVLADFLWPDYDQTYARKNLTNSLSTLSQTLSENWFEKDRATITLVAGDDLWVDVSHFKALLSEVEQHDHPPDAVCTECISGLEQAAALYQDHFLSGFSLADSPDFEQWQARTAEFWRSEAAQVLEKLSRAYAAQGDIKAAIDPAHRCLTQIDPFHEPALRQLLQLYTRLGERVKALHTYEEWVRRLQADLDQPPEPATVELYEAIKSQQFSPAPSSGPDRFPGPVNQKAMAFAQPQASTLSPAATVPQPSAINLIQQIIAQAPLPNLYTTLSRLDPLPDQKLFGIEAVQDKLEQALQSQDRPWLVAIAGMGGLGKTALANASAHHFVMRQHFYDLAWVRAKQEGIPAEEALLPPRPMATDQVTGDRPALDSEALTDALLEQLLPQANPAQSALEKRTILTTLLKQHPYLIIIDNLETMADCRALLPFLRLLSRPTKFLLTSRFTLHSFSDVYSISLGELSQPEALNFMRYEAEVRNIGALAQATTAQLEQIYEGVGGNPLALKLIIGQIGFSPLSQILGGLTEVKNQQIRALYHYLYQQSWQTLDEVARQVLITLLVNPNGSFNQLQSITALADSDLQRVLVNLTSRSLVNTAGTLEQPRYQLHRLTETFLLQEIEREERRNALQPVVRHSLNYWANQEAVQAVAVTILDQERDGILQTLFFGLEMAEVWPLVKALVIAFTPYMERRGHWEIWNRLLSQAIERAQGIHDSEGELTLMSLLARLYQRQSRPKEVAYYYRRVIHRARQRGSRFETARACSNLGYLYIDEGHWWRSEVLGCYALQIFKTLASDHGQAHTENHLGLLAIRQKLWTEAENRLKRACAIWAGMPDDFSLIYGYSNLGVLYYETGRPDEALTYFGKAHQQAKSVGEEAEIGNIWNNMGVTYRQKRDLEQAEAYAREAEAVFFGFSNLLGLAQVWGNLGLVYTEREAWDEALHHFKMSLNVYRKLGNQAGEAREVVHILDAELAKAITDKTVLDHWLQELAQLALQHPQKDGRERLQQQLQAYRCRMAG